MKNKLTDLNNHLFAQIERLGDEEISKEDLEKEIKRSKAISEISSKIVDNARVSLDAIKFASDMPGNIKKLPEMLESKND